MYSSGGMHDIVLRVKAVLSVFWLPHALTAVVQRAALRDACVHIVHGVSGNRTRVTIRPSLNDKSTAEIVNNFT